MPGSTSNSKNWEKAAEQNSEKLPYCLESSPRLNKMETSSPNVIFEAIEYLKRQNYPPFSKINTMNICLKVFFAKESMGISNTHFPKLRGQRLLLLCERTVLVEVYSHSRHLLIFASTLSLESWNPGISVNFSLTTAALSTFLLQFLTLDYITVG